MNSLPAKCYRKYYSVGLNELDKPIKPENLQEYLKGNSVNFGDRSDNLVFEPIEAKESMLFWFSRMQKIWKQCSETNFCPIQLVK